MRCAEKRAMGARRGRGRERGARAMGARGWERWRRGDARGGGAVVVRRSCGGLDIVCARRARARGGWCARACGTGTAPCETGSEGLKP
mmetsp:Transcript_666/g.1334  ORF Transcript_666/g.1334 Transcript_666/m.1334 type:complete len:88 (-) Transcript_666:584-847(-)